MNNENLEAVTAEMENAQNGERPAERSLSPNNQAKVLVFRGIYESLLHQVLLGLNRSGCPVSNVSSCAICSRALIDQ